MRRPLRNFFVVITLFYFAGVMWFFAQDFFPPSAKHFQESVSARLRIPSIAVNAVVQSVGLTPQGSIGIPTNYTDVAWFTGSPRPGSVGNAIMSGHRDTRFFAPGVFRHLTDLKIGDDVYVDGSDGKTVHFRVVEKKTYTEDTDRLAEITGETNRTLLNLITCEGIWNQLVRRYDKRLVVFTELVKD